MDERAVFERYELKYLMTRQQREAILQVMEPYMALDAYGHSEIRNLYYDTEDFRLIRTSLEQPVYKEKIRLRSYGRAGESSTAYVELKKKYLGVVYKRRFGLDYTGAVDCLAGLRPMPDSQIGREIGYALTLYTPEPKVFLSYEREAFYERSGGDFRVTFDENIRCRTHDLTLTGDCTGIPLLPENQVLMEVKTSGGLPLWMVRALSELKIRKVRFSKYGCAFEQMQKSRI